MNPLEFDKTLICDLSQPPPNLAFTGSILHQFMQPTLKLLNPACSMVLLDKGLISP
jgi:hypothetical protein